MRLKRANELHGMTNTPEYGAWHAMIKRCEEENGKMYYLYGGRGIKVHPEWRASFIAFFDHVGYRPSPSHSLDRIDSDGDYAPGNVRWATKTQQVVNRRIMSNNTSGYKGVHWAKEKNAGHGGWAARAFYGGSNVYIVICDFCEEVAWMYDQWMLELYGEFARLNFVYEEIS